MSVLDRLIDKLPVDSKRPKPVEAVTVDSVLAAWGGCSFGQGRYQVVTADLSAELSDTIASAFPAEFGRVRVFGADSAGRLFCALPTVGGGGIIGVYRFDVERTTVRCVGFDVADFHENVVADPDGMLDEVMYQKWVSFGHPFPVAGQCVGFDYPVRLGGSEGQTNRSVSNLAVYVSMTFQIGAAI